MALANDSERPDASDNAVPLRCVKMTDNGIATRFKPTAKGKYKVTVEYTFGVPDTKEVEAKMIILDGRFTGYPTLTKEADESWVTIGTDTKSTVKEEDDFLQKLREREADSTDSQGGTAGEGDRGKKKKPPRVSLEKQLTQDRTVAHLVGASNIDSAARKFSSLDEVTEIMKRAGLQSSNLIFGIDYTASNKTQGLHSFHGQSLHKIDHFKLNPYQRAISVIGKTLEFFMSDPVIPAYGFGDVKTSDTAVFPIYGHDGQYCQNFGQVLDVYNTMTPKIILSGPTNFAPIIKQVIEIYKARPNYYILVIVADGQVNNEPATVNAIVRASEYPISILVVGVGDGPWNTMNDFDRKIPSREWDNFDFVDFHAVTQGAKHPEASFALHALSGLPDQYAAITKLGLL